MGVHLVTDRENDSKLHQLMILVERSFSKLMRQVPDFYIEKTSILIHEVMSARWRIYHVSDHLITLGKDLAPVGTLSALFHDLVYLQVDKRIHPKLSPYLPGIQMRPGNQVHLPRPEEMGSHRDIRWVYQIFGFKAGQMLSPGHGLNEFLSAIVAVHLLRSYLTTPEILEVITSIEATIAFRGKDAFGKTSSERLFERLSKLNQSHSLRLSRRALRQIIEKSVKMANQDVANFASPCIGNFLDSTWKLILEDNSIFRNPLFNLTHYRVALQKVQGFYRSLDSEIIFKRFDGTPKKKEWKGLQARSQKNLKDGIEYIQVKSLSLGILEAIADLTGGGGPMILFMGSIPTDSHSPRFRMENHLDMTIRLRKDGRENPVVVKLLEEGRPGPVDFDIKNSPLGAYIYARLSASDLTRAYTSSLEYFQGHITALQFLKKLPSPIIVSIMRAVGKVAWSRKKALRQLEREAFGSSLQIRKKALK